MLVLNMAMGIVCGFLMHKQERALIRANRGGSHGDLTPHCCSIEAETDVIQMCYD